MCVAQSVLTIGCLGCHYIEWYSHMAETMTSPLYMSWRFYWGPLLVWPPFVCSRSTL